MTFAVLMLAGVILAILEIEHPHCDAGICVYGFQISPQVQFIGIIQANGTANPSLVA